MKKWIIAICAACVLLLILIVSAKPEPPVDPKDIKPNEVYSHELGVGIRLGMSKYRVDKLLGEGTKVDEKEWKGTRSFYYHSVYSCYSYCNGSLIIGYSNAVLYYISIYDDTFFAYEGSMIGSDFVPGGYTFSNTNQEIIGGGIMDRYSWQFDSNHHLVPLGKGSGSYYISIIFLNGAADTIKLHKTDYLLSSEPADAVPLWWVRYNKFRK